MAWVMPVLAGVESVMSAITFIQFIQEEAIQACSLGVFLAIKQRRYQTAGNALVVLRNTLVWHLKAVNEAVGWLAPYSKGAFQDFILASETAIKIYEDLLLAAPKFK